MVYRALNNADEGDVVTGTRICRVCDERKPMTAFYWTASRRHRVRACSSCMVERARGRREENRDQAALRSFTGNLRRSYGMTEEDYHALMGAQGGRCAVCRGDFTGRSPHVDHDHETGAVRGILCFVCNTAIGKMRDDPALLRAAADYLEQPLPKIKGRSRNLTTEEIRAVRSSAARKTHASPRGQAHLKNRARGQANPAARLSDQAVTEIRRRYLAGEVSQRALADEYGCSQSHVSLIVLGKLRTAPSEVTA